MTWSSSVTADLLGVGAGSAWDPLAGSFPAGALGSVAQLFVLAPVDDVGPPQVPDGRAECVHEPGEGPEGEQQERRERVQLEPDRRLAHEVWVQVEAEDAAEPDRDACSVVIVTKHVRHNSVDHAEDDHGPEHRLARPSGPGPSALNSGTVSPRSRFHLPTPSAPKRNPRDPLGTTGAPVEASSITLMKSECSLPSARSEAVRNLPGT